MFLWAIRWGSNAPSRLLNIMRMADFIKTIQRLVGDPFGDFHKTEAILETANDCLVEISTRSQSITNSLFIPVIKGQYKYGLTDGVLDVLHVKYNYSGEEWYELTPATLSDIEAVSDEQFQREPTQYELWGRSAIEKVAGEAVIAVGDEVFSVVLVDELNKNGFTGAINEIAIDIPVPSLLPGDIIENITDMSDGLVEASATYYTTQDSDRDGFTVIRHSNMLRGSTYYFQDDLPGTDDAESIRIRSPHTFNHTLLVAPTPDVSDKRGEESLAVFLSREHKQVTMKDMENENDFLEIDTELLMAVRHLVLYYIKMPEFGASHLECKEHMAQYEHLYWQKDPFVRARVRQKISTWNNGLSNRGNIWWPRTTGPDSSDDIVFNTVNITK